MVFLALNVPFAGSGQAKGKGKEKKEGARQTTLFGLPPGQAAAADKKAAGRKKKAGTPDEDSQGSTQPTQVADESQADTVMDDAPTGDDTQPAEEAAQAEETQLADEMEAEDDIIEWPASPEPRSRELEASAD